MKKRTNFLITLFLAGTSFLALPVFAAKEVASLIELKGNVFYFKDKQTKRLRLGDPIEEMSEIMVEDGSLATIETPFGEQFYVIGGTQMKFMQGLTQLRNGKVWVRSVDSGSATILESINSQAHYQKGEFIFSFDNTSGKSQLLVLDGDVNFKSSLDPYMNVDVLPGKFTILDRNYNDGRPRVPTKVGLKSYQSIKMAFKGIDHIDRSDFAALFGGKTRRSKSRSIASIRGKEQLKIIPPKASMDKFSLKEKSFAMDYYKEVVRRKKKKKAGPVAKIEFFGFGEEDTELKKIKKRKPSSKIPVNKEKKEMPKVPKTSSIESEIESEKMPVRAPASTETEEVIRDLESAFDHSIQRQDVEQKRHPGEVNELIDELKSYNRNYKKEY